MRYIGLEEIQALFQTWPESFCHRFKRKIKKSEILQAIDQRSKELEILELKKTFDLYSFSELQRIKEYLLNTEVEFIQHENNKTHKFNIIDKFSAKKSDT